MGCACFIPLNEFHEAHTRKCQIGIERSEVDLAKKQVWLNNTQGCLDCRNNQQRCDHLYNFMQIEAETEDWELWWQDLCKQKFG